MNKKLSIITVNYNNAAGLQKTVESLLSQTWRNFEYIVLDGGSTDGSANYLAMYNTEITYWVSEPDQGIYDAMNKGIAKATGEYLFFLNSGDHFNHIDALAQIEKELQQDGFIYFDIKVVTASTSFTLHNPEKFSFVYLHNNLPCHQCTFIHKTVFERVGHYDTTLKIVADWKLLLLAVLKHNFSYRKVAGVFTTFYQDGISSLPENKATIDAERATVLATEFPILMQDLKEYNYLQRVLRNLRKSRKIQWMIRLGWLDQF